MMQLTRAITATAAAGMAFAGPTPAHAATLTVTSVPCSVPALVTAISGAASGDTLSLAAGCLYRLTTGLPMVSQTLTIDGGGATLKRSTAKTVPQFTILQASGGTLTVNDLNFRNGDNAITITGNTALIVNGGKFIGNSGANGGAISDGGAFPDAPSGVNGPVITGAWFTANTATGSGGAIYDYTAQEGADLTDCTFTRNQAAGSGGGIYDYAANGDLVTGTRFYANHAADGGGALLTMNGIPTLSHVTARGNTAAGSGGGIYLEGAGITVENSVIDANQAAAGGGGLYFEAGIQDDLTGTVIRGNTAADGGGIYITAPAQLTLTGDKIAGNDASGYGGGIYNATNGVDTATAADTRIVRNTAGAGGGGIYEHEVFGLGTFTLTASQVRGNQPDNCEPAGTVTGCRG